MMDVIHGFRTIFPMTLGLGAAFDPELVIVVGDYSAADVYFDRCLKERLSRFHYFSSGSPFFVPRRPFFVKK